jgi:ribosomal protein S18 acetylase RimI-like enzyme
MVYSKGDSRLPDGKLLLSGRDGKSGWSGKVACKELLTAGKQLHGLQAPVVRPARAADLAPLVALDRECFGRRAWPVRGWWEVVTEPGWTTLVLAGGDELLGAMVLLLGVPVTSLASLAISPRFRNCGLGTEMLRQAVSLAQQARARFLTLEVDAANRAARRLYTRERFGLVRRFREDGRWRVEMHRRLGFPRSR